jgi:uncharacterized PurR-regulated membrane protein YhhQ (DUF165 family)
MARFGWTALYILAIVLVNKLFVVVPPLPTPLGDLYLASVLVGVVFVLRDYAQREVGHRILIATAIAGVITWAMTNAGLAFASVVAFAISETTDWAVFSFTRRPLQSRILISSLLSVPVDTLAFLHLSGYLTPATFAMEIASKAAGVAMVWTLLRWREQNRLQAAA